MQRAWAICAVWLLCLFGAQNAAAVEPIRVGMTVALTGPYAELGRMQYEGAQMWADDLNERGALLGRRVELVYYDDESDPAKSADLYEKLIMQDGVDLLLGPYSSDITMAASSVAERHMSSRIDNLQNTPDQRLSIAQAKVFVADHLCQDIPVNPGSDAVPHG